MQEHPRPKTVQSPACPDQETFDRIMRIARRDPITGPALKPPTRSRTTPHPRPASRSLPA